MRKFIFVLATCLSVTSITRAQVSTAQDFTMSDCASNTQNLYSYLDNGEVVIMEFFMTCASCIADGQKISAMMNGVDSQYPGMVNFWALAYTNSYTCTTCNNWVASNSINAVPFDSGAAQVAYYGGFQMPTVVVVAGPLHQVIYNSNYDGLSGDTAAMHAAINNFFNTTGVENNTGNVQFTAYPNPATHILNLELNVLSTAMVGIDMVDMTGKVVRQVSNNELTVGPHQIQVETSDLSNGIYFIRVNSNGQSSQYKVSVKH